MTTLSFNVLWNGNAAERGLHNLGNQAVVAHGKISKLSGIATTAIGTAIGGVAAFGAAKLAGLGASAVVTGVKTAAGMETARIGFTTMLGSATKADKFLKQLADFAAKTPFEFPELQQSASQLVAIGIKTKDVIPIMTNLGNITAGMGTGSEGIKRAVVAIQQMNAAGKISAQDLNQLRDAGVPVYELLAKATGKSAAQVANMAAKGKLGRHELDQLMASLQSGKGLDRFNGLMDKSSQSLQGLWSTLKDTFSQGLAQAIGPAIPLMKSALGAISGGLQRVFKWAADNKSSISDLFTTAGNTLKAFGQIAGGVLGPFIHSLTGGQNVFKAFANFISEHQTDIVKGFIKVSKVALGVGDAILGMASTGLRGLAFLIEQSGNLRGVFLDVFSSIIHGAATAFGWIPGIGPKLKAADASFASFAAASKAGTDKAAAGARAVADAIDLKLRPAIKVAQDALDKVGKTQIVKAQLRDSAAKAAHAIEDIGTKANGAQIHLKKWSDVSKLGTMVQAQLSTNIVNAQIALHQQVDAVRKAKGGQEALTAAWKIGRARLYDEFIQMGLSKAEAGRLANKYAGVKPKVMTTFTQPGMHDAQHNADTLKNKYGELNRMSVSTRINWDTAVDKINTTMRARGSHVVIGYSEGGYTGNRSASAVAGVVHGGEHVIRASSRRQIEAAQPGALDYMNKTGRLPGYADGGRVLSTFHQEATGAVLKMGTAAVASELKRLASSLAGPSGLSGSGAIVGSPAHLIRERNGWWSALFAANIRRAEHAAGRRFVVYQAGFNHGRVAASGSTHDGDAIDARQDMVLRNAFRRYVGAMWFRNWPGNYHMHGVPAPGRGYPSPSAKWQYQDYLHGGDGLSTGGMASRAGLYPLAEHGRERVLSNRQTNAFENLVPVLNRGGVGGTVHVTINASFPNYVGNRSELKRALVDMGRNGDMKAVFQSAGR